MSHHWSHPYGPVAGKVPAAAIGKPWRLVLEHLVRVAEDPMEAGAAKLAQGWPEKSTWGQKKQLSQRQEGTIVSESQVLPCLPGSRGPPSSPSHLLLSILNNHSLHGEFIFNISKYRNTTRPCMTSIHEIDE